MNRKLLLRQLIGDMNRLHSLIVRVARGERRLKLEQDQLQMAVDINVALLCSGQNEKANEHPILR
ncbi:MAG: hypothetical protein O7G87_08165 [bacterium]|nr:hypothetical protein [bacterium]